MNNEEIVKAVEKVNQHEREISEIKLDVKELKKKNDLLLELSHSVKMLVENLTNIKEDVSEIKDGQNKLKDEIKEVKERPLKEKAKIYDKVVAALFGAIVTGVIAFILSQAFPKIFN